MGGSLQSEKKEKVRVVSLFTGTFAAGRVERRMPLAALQAERGRGLFDDLAIIRIARTLLGSDWSRTRQISNWRIATIREERES
jgi:hypothetical protein